jgi:hypothetical protein
MGPLSGYGDMSIRNVACTGQLTSRFRVLVYLNNMMYDV